MRQARAGRAPDGVDPAGAAEAVTSRGPGGVAVGEPRGGARAEPAGEPEAGPAALRRLLDSAEHFLICRDRARAYAPWSDTGAPVSLAEAIARDFAGFDVEQAEADFRTALAALSGRPPHRMA